MVTITYLKDDIIKVSLGLNIILLLIGLVLNSNFVLYLCIIINLIFNATHVIISKYGNTFQSKNPLFKALDDSLNYFYGWGRK